MRIAGISFKRVKKSRGRAAAGLIILVLASALIAGCTEVPNPTATAVPFEPTPAAPGTRELVLAGASAADLAAFAAEPIELPEGVASNGEALHTTLGCAACHSIADDTIVGPGWKGLYTRAGERTELDAEDYIVQSITKPSKFIAEGFTNVMPSFDYLSDQELADLIAFVKANE